VHAQPVCFAAFEATLRQLERTFQITAHAASTVASETAAAILGQNKSAFRRVAGIYAGKLQLQLFSLCMSCMKCAAGSMAADPPPQLMRPTVLHIVQRVSHVASCMLDDCSPSSSSSSSGSAAAAAEPWVVLLSRCLLLAKDVLERVALWDAEVGSVQNAAAAAEVAADICHDTMQHTGEYVGLHCPAAADPEFDPAFRREVQDRLEGVPRTSLMLASACGSACCPSAAAAATAAGLTDVQLLADLFTAMQEGHLKSIDSYSDRVAALLPLLHACNNLYCESLEQRSELALVSGKGRRCSGCKVAR
jgi:hypothetical protein